MHGVVFFLLACTAVYKKMGFFFKMKHYFTGGVERVLYMKIWGNYLFAIYVLVAYLHPDTFVQVESTQS